MVVAAKGRRFSPPTPPTVLDIPLRSQLLAARSAAGHPASLLMLVYLMLPPLCDGIESYPAACSLLTQQQAKSGCAAKNERHGQLIEVEIDKTFAGFVIKNIYTIIARNNFQNVTQIATL